MTKKSLLAAWALTLFFPMLRLGAWVLTNDSVAVTGQALAQAATLPRDRTRVCP